MNNFLNNSLQYQQNPLQQRILAMLLNGGKMNFANSQNPLNTGSTAQLNPANTSHGCNLNLDDHLKYVDSLVLLKIIDENTGKMIKQNITAKFNYNNALSAYDGLNNRYNKENSGVNSLKPAMGAPYDFSQSEFLKARECLLNYLQNSGVELDEEDLKEIEAVVLELEKNALMHENLNKGINSFDSLNRDNESAKKRLMTGSMRGSSTQKPPEKLFSREEIAKMSTAEFIKNEPVINYQLQNGLL